MWLTVVGAVLLLTVALVWGLCEPSKGATTDTTGGKTTPSTGAAR